MKKLVKESLNESYNESQEMQFNSDVYDALMDEYDLTPEEADFGVAEIEGNTEYEMLSMDSSHSPGAVSQAAELIASEVFGK